MQYFIGLVPPQEYSQRVVAFQRRWAHQVLVDLVEPHITVKAQGGLTPDLKWLAAVNEACAETAPFEVRFGEPNHFGEHVLFLSVHSAGVRPLHEQLLAAVNPSEELVRQYFEGDAWHGHLTLGTTGHGMTAEDVQEMTMRAVQELQPYPTFTAAFVRVYRLDERKKRYVKVLDIPLTGNL